MIELEEDIHPLRQLALQDFSYSRLDTYTTCHMKYFLSYVLREPHEYGPAAMLGNMVHTALEFTVESDEKIKLFDLLQNYQAAQNQYDPEGTKVSEQYITSGESMLTEFVDRHGDEKYNIIAKEMPFSVVIGNARFNGFIDRVDIENNRVHIIDYKSGKREVAANSIENNLQLGIYALVASYMYPDKEIYAELYYLQSGRRKGHLFTTDDLSRVETELKTLVNEVLSKGDFHPTSDESKCWWCDYATTGACSAGYKRTHRRRASNYSD